MKKNQTVLRLTEVFLLVLLLWAGAPMCVNASTENSEAKDANDYLELWLEKLDFDDLDELVEQEMFAEQREKIKFSDIVEALLTEGIQGVDGELLKNCISDAFIYELAENRQVLAQVVLLAVVFSVLHNFTGTFQSGYIANLLFLMVYCVMAVLLLTAFLDFGDLVEDALSQGVDFMKMLVPTFCFSMIFAAGTESAAGFYQLAFLVIYLIQWLFLNILSPMVHIYVLIELFNHFYEDEKFQNLSELLHSAIRISMKMAGTIVVGLNVVQGLILPAKDRLFGSATLKAASAIPGLGNTIGNVGEMLLGAGALIKNCVGVAALLVLVLIAIIPIFKILLLSLMYKVAAVVVEPVADKRFAGCLKGMAEGGVLYLQLLVYATALFFVTIALTTGASGISG